MLYIAADRLLNGVTVEIAELVEDVRPTTRWQHKESVSGRQVRYRPPHYHVAIRLAPAEVESLVNGVGLGDFVRYLGFVGALQSIDMFVVTVSPEQQSKLSLTTIDEVAEAVLAKATQRYANVVNKK